MSIYKLAFFFFLISYIVSAYSTDNADPEAHEIDTLKIEYYESSGRGIVIPIGCSTCTLKQYKFTKKPVIKRLDQENTSVEFSRFMEEYWKINIAVLGIDPVTREVVHVYYRLRQ